MLIPKQGEHDVVSGRGQGARNHPGNIFLLEKAREYKTLYNEAKRDQKKVIAQEVANLIKKRDPPGRFLLKQDMDNDTVMWLVQSYDDEKVVSKVQQIFRDLNKHDKHNQKHISNSGKASSPETPGHKPATKNVFQPKIPEMEPLPFQNMLNAIGNYPPVDHSRCSSDETILSTNLKTSHHQQPDDISCINEVSVDGNRTVQSNSSTFGMADSSLMYSTSLTATSHNERANGQKSLIPTFIVDPKKTSSVTEYIDDANTTSIISSESSSHTRQFSSKRKREERRSSFRKNTLRRSSLRKSLTLEDIQFLNGKTDHNAEHMSSLTMIDHINNDISLNDFDDKMSSFPSDSDQESMHSLSDGREFDLKEVTEQLISNQTSDNDILESRSCPPLFQNRSTSIAYKEELPAHLRYDYYEC